MPELPEVETVRRGLAAAMTGATILGVQQNRPDLRFPFPDDFAERLLGRRIEAVGRRAKYLMIGLDDGTVLASHLGMTGSFRIEAATGRGDTCRAPITSARAAAPDRTTTFGSSSIAALSSPTTTRAASASWCWSRDRSSQRIRCFATSASSP